MAASLSIVFGFLLSIVSVVSSPPAAAVPPVTEQRLAGADRYETARLTADAAFPTGASDVLLATGTNFPDALASSYVAGVLGAPVLLTEPGRLSPAAEAGLATLAPSDVTVLGSIDAIGEAVVSRLTTLGYTVHRIGGADRFETAALLATSQPATPVGTPGGRRTAIVASGANFPDALAGGPVAFDFGLPVLLTSPTGLPAPTAQALRDLNIQRVLLLGGTAAVAPTVETAIASLGITVNRVHGADRFATAEAIAHLAQSFGWSPTQMVLATGRNFPDALAAGPLGGARQAPIALTDDLVTLPTATAALCNHLRPTVNRLQVQGSVSVVSQAVVDQCRGALEGGGGGGGGCPLPAVTEELFGRARVHGIGTTPSLTRSVNSHGGTNSVERTEIGRYVIRFGCIGADGGVVHASAVGPSTTTQCNVLPWGLSGTSTLRAEVICFDAGGNPADSEFDVLFTRTKASATPLAHGWFRTGGPLAPAPEAFQFNSTGGVNTVTRLTTGSYIVDLPGLGGAGPGNGTPVVSTSGPFAGVCSVVAWAPTGTLQRVHVVCDDLTGAPIDRSFVLSFINGGPIVPGNAGPAASFWATPAIPPAPYVTNPANTFNSAGADIKVERPGPGSYRTTIGGAASSDGWVQVTAVASDARCMVDRSDPVGPDQAVDVFCYDAGTGSPRNTQFTVAYLG